MHSTTILLQCFCSGLQVNSRVFMIVHHTSCHPSFPDPRVAMCLLSHVTCSQPPHYCSSGLLESWVKSKVFIIGPHDNPSFPDSRMLIYLTMHVTSPSYHTAAVLQLRTLGKWHGKWSSHYSFTQERSAIFPTLQNGNGIYAFRTLGKLGERLDFYYNA